MNIFENLEQLNVSEECFNEIIGIVEELLSESLYEIIAKKRVEARDSGNEKEYEKWNDKYQKFRQTEIDKANQKAEEGAKKGSVIPYTSYNKPETKKYFPKGLRAEGSYAEPDRVQHDLLHREGYQRPSTKNEAGEIKTDKRRYKKVTTTHYLDEEPMYQSQHDELKAYDKGFHPVEKSQEQRTKERLEKRKKKNK